MLSKKNYKAIVRVLHQENLCRFRGKEFDLIDAFGVILKEDNSNFDFDKFVDDCMATQKGVI